MSQEILNKLGMCFTAAKINKENYQKLADKDFSSIFNKYKEYCAADEKFMEMHDDFNNIEHINRYSSFESIFRTVDKLGAKLFSYDDYRAKSFDEQLLNQSKMWAENLEEIKQEAEQKVEKIQKSFSLFKNKRIEKIKDELKYKERWADRYNYCYEQEQIKQDIINKYGSEEALEKLYTDKKMDLSKKALEEHIMEYPNAICFKRTGILSTSYIDHVSVSSKELNYFVNNLREEVKDYLVEVANDNMKKTKETSYEL